MTEKNSPWVMIVDDDDGILSQFQKVLQKVGISNIKTYTNGEDALKELESLHVVYNYIFVDVKMPSISGTALIQWIKNHKEKNIRTAFCIPIVGVISRDDKILLEELEIEQILSKPISEKSLISCFEEFIKIQENPESELNIRSQFNAFLQEKKFGQAEKLLLPRIKANPTSKTHLAMYAELLFRAKNLDKAEEILMRILKMDANYIPALNLLSKVYLKMQRFDEGMRLLEKAKALSPYNVDRLLVIGEMHLGSGKADKAEESFRGVLKLNPIDEKASYGLGRSLAVQGRVDESRRVLASLNKSAELACFFNNKGILLVQASKFEEGISLYKNAIKVMDDKKREYLLLYNIALAYSKLGYLNEALDYGEKAKEIAPANYLKIDDFMKKVESKMIEGSSNSKLHPEQQAVASKEGDKYLLTQDQLNFMTEGPVAEENSTPEVVKDAEFVTFGEQAPLTQNTDS